MKKPLVLSVAAVIGLLVATLWPVGHQAFCAGSVVL